MSAEAVVVSRESGMKSLMVAVREPVDLRDLREDLPPDMFCDGRSPWLDADVC